MAPVAQVLSPSSEGMPSPPRLGEKLSPIVEVGITIDMKLKKVIHNSNEKCRRDLTKNAQIKLYKAYAHLLKAKIPTNKQNLVNAINTIVNGVEKIEKERTHTLKLMEECAAQDKKFNEAVHSGSINRNGSVPELVREIDLAEEKRRYNAEIDAEIASSEEELMGGFFKLSEDFKRIADREGAKLFQNFKLMLPLGGVEGVTAAEGAANVGRVSSFQKWSKSSRVIINYGSEDEDEEEEEKEAEAEAEDEAFSEHDVSSKTFASPGTQEVNIFGDLSSEASNSPSNSSGYATDQTSRSNRSASSRRPNTRNYSHAEWSDNSSSLIYSESGESPAFRDDSPLYSLSEDFPTDFGGFSTWSDNGGGSDVQIMDSPARMSDQNVPSLWHQPHTVPPLVVNNSVGFKNVNTTAGYNRLMAQLNDSERVEDLDAINIDDPMSCDMIDPYY